MTDRPNDGAKRPPDRQTDQRVWLIAVVLLVALLRGCGEEELESPLVDTSNMAFIPAGTFLMGAPEGEGETTVGA